MGLLSHTAFIIYAEFSPLGYVLLGVFGQGTQRESIDMFVEGEYRYAEDFSLTHGFAFPETCPSPLSCMLLMYQNMCR